MNLSDIKPPAGQQRSKRRIGRGMGSRGKTSGRGHKGAKSVSGYSKMRGFEGGQMPMHRRLPKRGFSNALFRTEYAVVNLTRLNGLEGDTFDADRLMELGVIRKLKAGVKVLGTGDLTRAITVKAHAFSESAARKIQAAGGKAEVIGGAEA
ncbi:MAG: 50S ribosomal protein L15 [Bryobacteraceae bacterium]